MRLAAIGLSNAEIGARTSATPKTIETYVGELLIRFDVKNRTALVMKAFLMGLIEVAPDDIRRRRERED